MMHLRPSLVYYSSAHRCKMKAYRFVPKVLGLEAVSWKGHAQVCKILNNPKLKGILVLGSRLNLIFRF